MIRIVIAEDQGMVLGALASLIELESDLEIVARCRDGREALEAVREHEPEILVTDIEMPEFSGLDLALRLRDEGSGTRVIILTTFARSGYLRRAMDAGVRGYLLKDAPSERLAEAIRKVHAGGRSIAPELAAEAWDEPDPLTEREREVLRLAGDGLTSAEMAKKLFLSSGTVRNYLSEAIGKMGAGNRVEAARLARQKGWL